MTRLSFVTLLAALAACGGRAAAPAPAPRPAPATPPAAASATATATATAAAAPAPAPAVQAPAPRHPGEPERALVPGQAIVATFGAGDPVRGTRPVQLWSLNAVRGRTVQVDMHADSLDSYLVIQDTAGRFLSSDDNGGGHLNARLIFDPPATGRYRIIARAFRDTAGTYTIRLAEPTDATDGVVGIARRGQDVTGTLTETDPKLNDKPYQVWIIEANAGDSLTIDLTAGFDTFLHVQDNVGRGLAENDDWNGELNSHLVFVVPQAGRYRIIATGFAADARGPYTLRVR